MNTCSLEYGTLMIFLMIFLMNRSVELRTGTGHRTRSRPYEEGIMVRSILHTYPACRDEANKATTTSPNSSATRRRANLTS
eukprot:scaffold440086_cov18-Prasinocladus_malaysianus.AAC.1